MVLRQILSGYGMKVAGSHFVYVKLLHPYMQLYLQDILLLKFFNRFPKIIILSKFEYNHLVSMTHSVVNDLFMDL